MPELKDTSRGSWEDADVDVGSIPTPSRFKCSTFSLLTVGYLRLL